MQKFVYVHVHIVCTSVWAIINGEQSCSVSNLVIRHSLTWTVTLCVCNCVSLLPDEHSLKNKNVLPPWPAEVPGLCVGTEERVGACWWPLHCGSSVLTGSQTKKGKRHQHVLSHKYTHVLLSPQERRNATNSLLIKVNRYDRAGLKRNHGSTMSANSIRNKKNCC